MRNEWERDAMGFKTAIAVFLLLVGCSVLVKQNETSLQVTSCDTDSDCARKFGYNGDLVPIDNVFVCIHREYGPPCQL